MRSERFKIEKEEKERQRGEMMSCRRRSFMNPSRVCKKFHGCKIKNIKYQTKELCSLQFFPHQCAQQFSSSSSPPSASPPRFPNNARS